MASRSCIVDFASEEDSLLNHHTEQPANVMLSMTALYITPMVTYHQVWLIVKDLSLTHF